MLRKDYKLLKLPYIIFLYIPLNIIAAWKHSNYENHEFILKKRFQTGLIGVIYFVGN